MVKKFSDFMNECDGCAPNGGVTPGNVGGMGAIGFPGDNPPSTQGSGDIPLPTGGVYQQVNPFDQFLKTKWKKKKKKFKGKTSEDNPIYKHSPNDKVYDYVYDFKTYAQNIRSMN